MTLCFIGSATSNSGPCTTLKERDDMWIYESSHNYGNSQNCELTFTCSNHAMVSVVTDGRFDLENHNTCAYDYLQYDNGAKYCGTNGPNRYTHQETTKINFHSDGSTVGYGFRIRLQCI